MKNVLILLLMAVTLLAQEKVKSGNTFQLNIVGESYSYLQSIGPYSGETVVAVAAGPQIGFKNKGFKLLFFTGADFNISYSDSRFTFGVHSSQKKDGGFVLTEEFRIASSLFLGRLGVEKTVSRSWASGGQLQLIRSKEITQTGLVWINRFEIPDVLTVIINPNYSVASVPQTGRSKLLGGAGLTISISLPIANN